MIRELITLPLRTTWRGAELLFDGASRAISLALDLTGRSGGEPAEDSATRRDTEPAPGRQASSQSGSPQTPSVTGPPPATEAPPRPADRPVEPAGPPRSSPAPAAPASQAAESQAAESQAPHEPESAHVDQELELVAETADPGAADGAGAQLTIDEPWPGYQQLNADEIIDRLPTASAAELAVMELYEATHRRRRTVLSALQRQLNDRAHNGPADPGEG